MDDDTICINVGGTIFTTKLSTLQKYPDTLLGSLSIKLDCYSKEDKSFYFDRNPELFNTILDYYRNGVLHLPHHLCGWLWKTELEFWKIPLTDISECCHKTLSSHNKRVDVSNMLKSVFSPLNQSEYASPSGIGKLRHRLWLFLDEPASSTWAKVFSFIYLSIVLLSSSLPCLITHPGIRIQTSNATTIFALAAHNNVHMWINKDNPKEMQLATTKEPDWLYYWSLVISIFFSVETILRLVICSTKNKFVKEWLNILDIILFVIMWICYGIKHGYEKKLLSNKHLAYFLCFCEAVSVLRLFRFFRLAKQYSSLRILFIAVQSSARELLLLLITFFVFGWMFANLIYYTEILESESFPNMLVGFWWSVVTMTTVGYGDVYPIGPLGRVVGVLCSLCGLLVLAMPIAIIAGNFDSLCRHNEEREAYAELQSKQTSNIPKAWETSKIDPNYPSKLLKNHT
ncbi:potassium voltage-gated channel subfamily C member 1-like [Mytilus trossulus]|uniref:potassium voltage-gated channel subfamily C member 1-like n=1 Tax=Mytilus trossulus TaxID=6551 RepID=UPI003007AD85